MCWRLEFYKHSGTAKNRVTCGRLTLNIIGLVIVLIIGAVAAVFAGFSEDWFPRRPGNDGKYYPFVKSDSRVIEVTEETIKECTSNTTDPSRMMGRLVFKCGTNKIAECIPLSLRCDGYRDCTEDQSDELSCDDFCAKASKRNLRFQCDVMSSSSDDVLPKCMNTNYRCDGEVDCTGNSEDTNDESNCDETFEVAANDLKCSTMNSFVCKDNKLCVHLDYRCDGFKNCLDGSDEMNCN